MARLPRITDEFDCSVVSQRILASSIPSSASMASVARAWISPPPGSASRPRLFKACTMPRGSASSAKASVR